MSASTPQHGFGYARICGLEAVTPGGSVIVSRTAKALAAQLNKDAYRADGGDPPLRWDFVSEIVYRSARVHNAIETSAFTSGAVFSQAMEKSAGPRVVRTKKILRRFRCPNLRAV